MIKSFEGDLVRPLGLVTLYSAYAEGEIDQLLVALCAPQPFDEKMQQWTVGRKLIFAQRLVRALKAASLTGLIAALKDARALFEHRNALIHGRIYAGGRLISNRSDVPDRRVSPDELLDLAERIFTCKEHISMHRERHLLPVLNSSILERRP